jgi:molybdate transport system ATP-binding protein
MKSAGNEILAVTGLTVMKNGVRILDDISFVLYEGDHLAIMGESGSGKTQLGLALAGRTHAPGIAWSGTAAMNGIAWVEQQHHFRNLSNTDTFYYQQRFNSADSMDAITVKEYLGVSPEDIERMAGIDIGSLFSKPLIQLSNGENKKVQLVKALLSRPGVLVLDQPFTGLDISTRGVLHEILNNCAARGIMIILITGGEIPACISTIATLEKGRLLIMERAVDYVERRGQEAGHIKYTFDRQRLERLLQGSYPPFDKVIVMRNVSVRYGERDILRQVNWEVKAGECWLLSGPNGAGKSTLLSLVTGDNPQAYANEIFLFDRRRGSGESIWDIKKKIGYVSPELHLYFDRGSTVFEVIASGLFDTIGLFRHVPDEDAWRIGEWLDLLGLRRLMQRRLFELSLGEQRMMLLMRALIKDPPLLILDEPYQGLDDDQQDELSRLIDAICTGGKKALIFVTHEARRRPACVSEFLYLENGGVSSGIGNKE